jgi:hypothetical protein
MHRKVSLLLVASVACLIVAADGSAATKATSPNPADGAIGVLMPLLMWIPGDGVVLEDVFLGTTADLTAANRVSARQSVMLKMYYSPQALTPGQKYYWRIDGIGSDGVTVFRGDVWSFTAAPLIAFAPKPWDKAKWVALDVELSWRAGANAKSHDVYFGTDQAAVAARSPAAFKRNQNTVTYVPGALQEHTTYYWVVDEYDNGGTQHAGDVWSFTTTGPGGGVKAEYFGGTKVSGTPVLVQLEPSIDHSWGEGVVAGSLSDNVSARWTADLEAPLTETFTFITTSDDGVRLWLDGRLVIDNWTDHGTTDNVVAVDLIGGQIYALRMEWYDSGSGAVASLAWSSPSIPREVIPAGPLQWPLHARCSYPISGAAGVPQSLTLRWEAGDKAAEHDVYFGDSRDAVTSATPDTAGIYRGRQTLDALSYDVDALGWNKTYYWRVDEINEASPDSPWKGSTWSFTTADFIVIDDFESYTDESVGRIFQTWIDGLGYTEPDVVAGNGTGAVVGYVEAPFAEQKIVHGGHQSMPLDYNNAASPYYSETQRTWATPQDWTTNGVSVVLLYFRGGVGNGGGNLYVAIQDATGKTGVAIHPDPDRLTNARWTEWRIALSTFTDAGVNLAAVKKMAVGVGDRSNPKPGGAGRLYVDDIGVVRPGPGAVVLLSEGFEGLPLGKNVDEGLAGDKVWTKTAPAGWTIDDKGVPGAGNPAQDGVTEWAGWSFADRLWWTSTAGDQNRSQFTLGTGTVAIADPDEWDDLSHASGRWATYLSTPAVDISAVQSGSLKLTFDSSWRPEYADYGHQTGNLKVSFDGGKAVELFLWESDTASRNFKSDATNETVTVKIDNPGGAKKMVLTFGLFDCGNNWWWAIDNVEVTGAAK